MICGSACWGVHTGCCSIKLTALEGTPDRPEVCLSPTEPVRGAGGKPFAGTSFDMATLIHVGMNIADKRLAFGDVKRVLVPGGIFGVYDQMPEAPGDLTCLGCGAANRMRRRIASPANVPETSSVASPSMLPLPHWSCGRAAAPLQFHKSMLTDVGPVELWATR
jgi:SAM-dependent methyltransferase